MSAPENRGKALSRAAKRISGIENVDDTPVFREIPLFENYDPATRCGGELFRPSLTAHVTLYIVF